MIKEHIRGLGDFEFYDNYFIGRIAEGANASADYVSSLSDLITKHLPGKSPVYISDRVNSYSLDPQATSDLIARNNIKFAGIVVYSPHQKNNIFYEEKVIKGTVMCVFTDIDSAVTWAKQKSLMLN